MDNGSTDSTYDTAKKYTSNVIKEFNPGYGNACLAGIKFVNSLSQKPKYVCFFDADGQSRVRDIQKVLMPIFEGKVIYCHGSRMKIRNSRNSLTGSAYVANYVFSNILRIIWKQKLTDLGPLRCMTLDLLNNIKMKSKGYGWTIEMNSKLSKSKIIQLELAVGYNKRTTGKSKISGNFKSSLLAAIAMTLTFGNILLFWKPLNS